jgi:hypothetical protein
MRASSHFLFPYSCRAQLLNCLLFYFIFVFLLYYRLLACTQLSNIRNIFAKIRKKVEIAKRCLDYARHGNLIHNS